MIRVRYSCAACDVEEQEVDVRPREPGEDVAAWMREAVQAGIGIDHRSRSPWCRSTTAANVKIPLPKDGRGIGEEE